MIEEDESGVVAEGGGEFIEEFVGGGGMLRFGFLGESGVEGRGEEVGGGGGLGEGGGGVVVVVEERLALLLELVIRLFGMVGVIGLLLLVVLWVERCFEAGRGGGGRGSGDEGMRGGGEGGLGMGIAAALGLEAALAVDEDIPAQLLVLCAA